MDRSNSRSFRAALRSPNLRVVRGSDGHWTRRNWRRPINGNRGRSLTAAIRLGWLWLALVAVAGCAASSFVTQRGAPLNPLGLQLSLDSSQGPKPSPRTEQFLRRYDLTFDPKADPRGLLTGVQQVLNREPAPEGLYAAAELAYLGGIKLQAQKQPDDAGKLYGAAVAHAYQFLLDPRFADNRNAFDPQFRQGCDVYNSSLEAVLRILRNQGGLRPGATHTIESCGQVWEISVAVRGGLWRDEDIGRIEFVSDYAITGLQNTHHTYGLGVPLIVVRNNHERHDGAEQYYAPGLAFPMTAFVRLVPDENPPAAPAGAGGTGPAVGGNRHRAVIELYDPLSATEVAVDDRRVPLETDLSTPLAYCLDDPAFQRLDQPTLGLLRPNSQQALTGLYMLEPYQPNKIPVLMIHGIWSSPVTWMEMFNDLHASRELRDNYQFWFYVYPTGQPFWDSAAQLRQTLATLRATLDPEHRSVALDQMVLVGHSMGGLIAWLQTLDSGNDFWRLVSTAPPAMLRTDPAVRDSLAATYFFQPNPSIRRVITIATPFRGSEISNGTTQWIGRKLISFSEQVVQGQQQLRHDNPALFGKQSLIDVSTSIDSLSPQSSILPVMLSVPEGPWVTYHNIVGRLPQQDWLGRVSGEGVGDGIVPLTSSHLAIAASELVVPAAHQDVQRHPLTILEVRRILLQQAAELRQNPFGPPRVLTAERAAGTAR